VEVSIETSLGTACSVDQADAKEAMQRLDSYFSRVEEPTAAIVLQDQKRG